MSFKCTNIECSAPENKKGREYPSAMECPFCDVPLVEFSSFNEADLQLINTLPYVIAYPLKRTLEEKHPWTRINLFKDTFLNYLKYLGLLSASEFFQSPFKDKRMVALFHNTLAEPSFGTWNLFIRETLAFLHERNHSFFIPELPAYYETIETGKKRKLFKGEIEFIDSNGDVQIKKQEATAIGMLINFRNRYLGHGLTLDAPTSEKLWEEYYPIFKDLLLQMSFCKDYPMFKTEHGETFRLQSDDIHLVEKQNCAPGNVWLENSDQQSLDIIPFFVVPGEVAIAKEDKEQILAYESYTGKTIKFFSPEGTEKQTSGKILERLNMLLRDKQKEQPYSPEAFTKEIFLTRVAEENKLILDTLIAEKKVIPGVYVHREDMEIKLREWIGVRANIFVMAAEAGSGKTNLLVEIQKQYTEREMPTLLIRAGRMEKPTLHAQMCYLLNIDEHESLAHYPIITGTQDAPTFVLIDGLNEAHDAEKLWTELFEISKHFEPGSLKFVVTSRANTSADINRYGITEEQEIFLYGDNKDRENQVSGYTHWLTALSMEEMKQAWEYYVQKDKSKFKPQFAFDDLAIFDRALYNKISNPLVLRLFLETYQGKNLPKKGNQHLDIWSDWLTSFSEEEQAFFTALANAIWEKGENELLLDDVLKDNTLLPYFTNDQLNSPYPRLRNLGWISRYVKDLNACIGFAVEGALLHLLGKKLNKQELTIGLAEIKQLLQTGSPLQQAGVGAYLQQLALKGDLNMVCEVIDAGEEFIEACVTPIVLHLKTIGVKETLDILLQNPTENDWRALLKVDEVLIKLTLHPLRKELAIAVLPKNEFSSKASIQLGLREIRLIQKAEGELYLSKINLEESKYLDDAQICSSLGHVIKEYGNNDKALEWYHKCLDILLKTLGTEHSYVASTYDNIGLVYNSKGEYDKALEWYQKCLDIKLTTLGAGHPSVATTYNNIGVAWKNKGEYDKALEWYQECLEIQLKKLGALHPSVATSFNKIGGVYRNKGEYDKALEWYEKGLDIRLKTLGAEHPSVATSYNNIGLLCDNKGEYDKALEWYQKSLDIYLKTLGAEHPSVATSYNNIGAVCDSKGEYNKALEWYQKGLDIQLKTLGAEHPSVTTSYFNIGSVCANKGDYDKALEWYHKGLDIQLKTLGAEHPNVAISHYNLGSVHHNTGQYDKALAFYQLSMDILLKTMGNKDPAMATFYFEIGDCQKELQMYQEAIDSFKSGYEIEKLGGFPFYIGLCYEELAENENALQYYIQSAEIRKEDPDLGLVADSTQEAIAAAKRLAKELGKEDELPKWMKNDNQ